MCRVELVGVVGDERTERAQERLASVASIEQEFCPCPPSLGERVHVPFVRDETGRGYFGLAAIDKFVERQRGL